MAYICLFENGTGTRHRSRADRWKVWHALRSFVLALAMAWVPFAASAFDAGQAKTVDGVTIYLGMIPAEIIKGHPQTHPEASAHGGPPGGAHEFHIVIAIFDATNGTRITDAKIFARVATLGLIGPGKALEPMKIEDTITYGNYFDLPDAGPYTIDVDIEEQGRTVKAEFAYEHY